jgi:putative transposase
MRLQGYDYSMAGAYFVTIVAQGRKHLFGQMVEGEMRLNRAGEICKEALFDLPRHYKNVELGAFIVMPNHVHAIIFLDAPSTGGSVLRINPLPDESTSSIALLPDDPKTRPYRKEYNLSEIIRAFKSFSARRINLFRKQRDTQVWQRSFYDHIIRDQQDLEMTWLYIESNPAQWETDEENPRNPFLTNSF